MSEWRKTTLGELGSVERGRSRHRPRNDPRLFGGNMPFFQTGDVKSASLHMTSASQYYSEFGTSQSRVWDPGVTCITIAANIADTAVLGRRGCFPDSILGFTPTHQPSDAYYVKYLLDVYKNELTSAARGTTQDNLSLEKLLSHRFRVPDAITRDRISSALRCFDELIENTEQRIELLEQISQAIYREWFVRFRYPGHENAALVDTRRGSIPEGWEMSTCGEVLTVLGGGTPSKKEAAYWDGGTIPWYTPSDLTKRSARFAAQPEMRITEEGLSRSSAQLFPAGSVLMTSRATLGVLAIATTDASCNQGFIVILPDGRWTPSFIYEWLDDHADELEALATGATFKEITKGAFKRVPFLLPSAEVLEAFRDAVTPIDNEVRVLEDNNRTLASIRDLLLPKLMTGQIDVSALDLDTAVRSMA
jgi:type I restriction enzyme, S subunit